MKVEVEGRSIRLRDLYFVAFASQVQVPQSFLPRDDSPGTLTSTLTLNLNLQPQPPRRKYLTASTPMAQKVIQAEAAR